MASLVIAICFGIAFALSALAFVQAVESAARLRRLSDKE
jgi:hypothetical protein